MTHPVRLIEDLKKKMPNFELNYWVFGIFTTTHIEGVKGIKGIVTAAENRLIFFARTAEKDDMYVSIHYNKLSYIDLRVSGSTSLFCYLKDGSRIEMTFISRGDPEGLAAFLQKKCTGVQGNTDIPKADSV